MKDEMCNFHIMYWYDPGEDELGKRMEDSCDALFEDELDFPMDSDVLLLGSGQKVDMKRNLDDGKFACLFVCCVGYSNQHSSQLFNSIRYLHNPITADISLR